MQYYNNFGSYWDMDTSMILPFMQMSNMYVVKSSMPYSTMMQSPSMMPQTIPGMAAQDPYIYPQNLPEALKLIRDAVDGEKEDELFYDYLIKEAPSEEDKRIITSIRDDERKHNKMFRQMYYELTGQMLPQGTYPEFEKPVSYLAGVQKALFGELGAVERYRKILFAMQARKHINMMTEIITDELKHAHKYNFIFAKNNK